MNITDARTLVENTLGLTPEPTVKAVSDLLVTLLRGNESLPEDCWEDIVWALADAYRHGVKDATHRVVNDMPDVRFALTGYSF